MNRLRKLSYSYIVNEEGKKVRIDDYGNIMKDENNQPIEVDEPYFIEEEILENKRIDEHTKIYRVSSNHKEKYFTKEENAKTFIVQLLENLLNTDRYPITVHINELTLQEVFDTLLRGRFLRKDEVRLVNGQKIKISEQENIYQTIWNDIEQKENMSM